MNVEDFFPIYQTFDEKYDENIFAESILLKKEFYDNKLDVFEEKPNVKGKLMKHQEFISNFLSGVSIYNELLLIHYMGSGKTCSAVGTAEKLRENDNSIIRAIILARGDPLLENFKQEIVFTCTRGQYIPENYNDLDQPNKTRKINKNLGEFYSFYTFDKFSKLLENQNDSSIISSFSNSIVIIDEVHNLRFHKVDKTRQGEIIYNQIHRFLHLIRNRKILLLSGTPMKDRPEEIAIIMNLILPKNNQLPIGNDFINEYFELNADKTTSVKQNKIRKLKSYFLGRVSFLRAMSSKVKKEFIGDFYGDLQNFIVYPNEMSKFQYEAYIDANNKDKIIGQDLYSNTRQASLFIFPDGTYGSDGFDRYVIKKDSQKISFSGIQRTVMNISKFNFNTKLNDNIPKLIRAKTSEQMIQNLQKYSTKYANVIEQILKNDKQLTFVYCEFVLGSGIIIFSLILELFGFARTSGGELNSKARRYVIINNITTTTSTTRKILEEFNKERNKFGEYIQIIIGSRITGEGFTLKNIQQIHILSPFWNYSETDQAINRGIRLFSHKALTDVNIIPKIQIYQHVSLYNDKTILYIDLIMYLWSEIKDISIRRIDRILKEISVDCALNYERNFIKDADNSRDCEYEKCEFKCDNVVFPYTREEKKLDYSTYQLYYEKDEIQLLLKRVEEIFKNSFVYSIENLIREFPNITRFQLMSILNEIINISTMFKNKYGFENMFIKEKNNFLYMINGLLNTDFLTTYYVKNPQISLKRDFLYVLNIFKQKKLPSIISSIKTASPNMRINIIKELPIFVQEKFIEHSVLSIQKNIGNIKLSNWIVNYYKSYILNIDDTYVSTLLKEQKVGKNKCFTQGIFWENCDEKFNKKILKYNEEKKEKLEKSNIGYYGIYDQNKKIFKIRDVREDRLIKEEDKRKISRGINCNVSIKKEIIAKIISVHLGIKPPENFYKSKVKLIKILNKKKLNKQALLNYYEVNDLEELFENYSDKEISDIYYWIDMNKDLACKLIYEEFEKRNLIIIE